MTAVPLNADVRRAGFKMFVSAFVYEPLEAALTLRVAALAPVGYRDMLAKPPLTNSDTFRIRSLTLTSGRRLSLPAGPQRWIPSTR